jgi:hypothetical protein
MSGAKTVTLAVPIADGATALVATTWYVPTVDGAV